MHAAVEVAKYFRVFRRGGEALERHWGTAGLGTSVPLQVR